jgi:hypothetical protein
MSAHKGKSQPTRDLLRTTEGSYPRVLQSGNDRVKFRVESARESTRRLWHRHDRKSSFSFSVFSTLHTHFFCPWWPVKRKRADAR